MTVARCNVVPAERRSAPRLATLLACSLKIESSATSGYLLSCSATGALLALTLEAQCGNSVDISLDLPWLKKSITVSGRVARTFRDESFPQATHRCAVEFEAFTAESALLMNLVTTRDKLGVRRFR